MRTEAAADRGGNRAVLGVLLAGGLARRMGGGDKPLRRVGGLTILERAIARFHPQVDHLVLNANGDPARFAGFGLAVVPDPVPDHPGPLAGVLAGMAEAARGGFGALVTVSADCPFLPRDLVPRLEQARAGAGVPLACAASGGFTHPTIGLWPAHLHDDLAAALKAGERKIDRWTARHGCVAATWPHSPVDPFFNANTPEDLDTAEAILAADPQA